MEFLADTITSLIVADIAYLFLLNAAIGFLEGTLLRRLFSGGRRAVWWMIAANYLSAWIGWIALAGIWSNPHVRALLAPAPIERINLLAGITVLLSFAITLLIEWPFVHWGTVRPRRSIGRTTLATFCVNSISYLLLCLWFLWTSFTLPFNARVVSLIDMGPFPQGTLYWIDPTGRVIARDLRGKGGNLRVGQMMQNDFIWPCQLRVDPASNRQHVQIDVEYATSTYADRPTPSDVKPPDPVVIADAGRASAFPRDYWDQSRTLQNDVVDLRPAEHRQMRVTFDWYRHYLDTKVPGGPHTHLYVGLINWDWELQQPTILPDDKIVFEWEKQILLFDPHTANIAFIANGSCPAFVP
ncbi:MAG TPA: hypothetical protein VG722_09640 [Tepidisphaeraceae bacterium]|nr:hypothetical protein [Tepidisphaeraceae bacterium]